MMIRRMEFSTDDSERPMSEKEKELGRLHREVRDAFANGDFETAMTSARDAESTAREMYGEEHPVLASCMNNIGLLQKTQGFYDDAVKTFEEAARVYYHSVGPESRSTATTFHNLALCYKAVADRETSEHRKLSALDQAQITFEDALKSCKVALGDDHPTTALSASGLASVLRELAQRSNLKKKARKDMERAESLHMEAFRSLESSEKHANSLAMATVANNFAYHIKQIQDEERYNDAVNLYLRAVETRLQRLSPTHPDTITARHNLAEMMIVLGRDEDAALIQEEILRDLGYEEEGGGDAE